MWMFEEALSDQDGEQPYEIAAAKNDMEYIMNLCRNIDEREVKVLMMRYGIATGEPMTLQEIGERLNIARERVRQIENHAMQKLKALAASRARLREGEAE